MPLCLERHVNLPFSIFNCVIIFQKVYVFSIFHAICMVKGVSFISPACLDSLHKLKLQKGLL